MTLTLAELNRLPAARASDHFRACCASTRWAAVMTARRPYASVEALLQTADQVWRNARPSDWRQAFDAHPRIGERAAPGRVGVRSSAWSAEEQREAGQPDQATRGALARANAEYERRFGRVYLVCASGKTAADLLADLRARLDNAPERELSVSAEEQRKITRLRLLKLLGTED